MIFEYGNNENKLKYINKVNASADHEIYYTTNFSITLPKGIINWAKSDNNFFFEYDDKQIIYIYSAYKNEEKESDDWKLLEVEPNDIGNYLNNYWEKRGYKEEYLFKEHVGRISKIYTNGKYKILLYNIKPEKFSTFTQSAKTFNVIF
ncbi:MULTISPECIES: hypothetical protein [unclassified Chryseobacterium]|uniref:hypothetical protein n=1 Tax=unclassified Chryseobacterium TaxID=2593645 RepID=UPI00100B9023|nr:MULTISPECIES: hypothetical protein [unclassified Chryseobacterium]RXM50331.1 hypothetical protein BOQ64_18045 [Chryseobacterium sp. CH25]RXM64472.1 hypothetical protein BOQ60_09535 [Chryseobacterium sp. CH1]